MQYLALATGALLLLAVTGSAFAADPPGALTGVHRIMFVGDSLTDGSAWADWVVETLQADGHPGLRLFNAGVAGDTIAKVKARYEHDVLALQPDLVIIDIGTNDVNTGVPLEQFRRDLEEVVGRIRKGGAKVLLMTPPAMRDPVKNEKLHPLNEIVQAVAKAHGCAFFDLHVPFEASAAAGKEPWGPDGIHHTIIGWRLMGRGTLDALGCKAAMVEKTSLYPGALTDWLISPAIPWKSGQPYPPLPAIPADPLAAGWRKFDREAALAKTSWWQACWLQRGGILPMGKQPADQEAGAYSLAILHADKETRTTLHLGGSSPYAVWLNGELLWECKTNRGYHPDAERIAVTLHKGDNQLLVFTNWLFYVSVDAVAGGK